jgi:AraC-like DNA-binding protein
MVLNPQGPPMQQIADWLQKLGMSEYAQRFAENRIDFSVLPDLTDQDLKDLGVALGDRRKILRAIAGLRSTEAVAPSPATEAVIARPQDAAERRQVTVMFSDLVGSTALSARMDPEDLREVISAYQKCVAETVQRFGGLVAKMLALLGQRATAKAVIAMLRDPSYEWTLGELAARAVVSRATLIRSFGRISGLAPLTFLTELRLALARRQLATTRNPISQIAADTGYQSEAALRVYPGTSSWIA